LTGEVLFNHNTAEVSDKAAVGAEGVTVKHIRKGHSFENKTDIDYFTDEYYYSANGMRREKSPC
jgi:hypothetical protein